MSTEARSVRILRSVLLFIANSLLALLGGFALMLAVAVAHAHWITTLPTIGYWWSVLLVYLLRGSFTTISKRDLELDR
jgi:ethanolamine transporter EutH